ncbi:class I SAM-dependent methyltransferase [Variovorax sp. J22R133]|uniref:class I SAM-dependent methyltransferase n=1 Tax=Variovorax brevis TaxID=3053503 RepID=UPI002578BFC3|nr:class I SAM-dependent methyltransferase [Variovorax sp. J22R133]MDM0113667.1 class I SAM-dependent methyltransferase [Variovorax sp. J22R133]
MQQIDENKLNALLGRMVEEFGAMASAPLVILGDRLGLYKAMAGAGPLTVDQFSEKTHLRLRYALEWLNAQAASGFVDYDPKAQTYTFSPEAALALADDSSPAFMVGGFECLMSMFLDIDKVQKAFRDGTGLGWHEHHPSLFTGTERFFRAGYNASLEPSWIPALDGMSERLQAGARVADVGCGFGASTIVLAQAYPRSTFIGYDFHEPSISAARERAAAAGVADRVSFEVAGAKTYPGRDFDLVAFFDCLHDMGDPVGAARHVRETLAPNGTWMIVEPFANDRLEDNINPVGRIFYSASTMICTPCSLSQEVGLGLGAQAGEERLGKVVREGGFGRFRRAAQTPFNLVFEARA